MRFIGVDTAAHHLEDLTDDHVKCPDANTAQNNQQAERPGERRHATEQGPG